MGFTFVDPTEAVTSYQKAEQMHREAYILKSQFSSVLIQ